MYSGEKGENLLASYARHFDTVEVDQWFWSLFGSDKVKLPELSTVQDYVDAVPDSFRFAVKLPNALTLSHLRPARRGDPLVANPHFLSPAFFEDTMSRLLPMHP